MPPYEYFAMKYINQWLLKERALHANLSEKHVSEDIVSKSLHFFQVLRTFKGLSDGDGKEFIVKALLDNSKRLTSTNFPAKVEKLADDFNDKFSTRNISASSKLMWLRKRSPVIIYDKWAKKALVNKGLSKQASYAEYCKAWNVEYDKHQKAIKKACVKLLDAKDFCALWELTITESRDIVKSDWFQERVLDMYLLHEAKNS
jgi:hypothetical protein